MQPSLWNLQIHDIKPIQALKNPSFKEMIAVAARATHGVVIPTTKATRAYIIKLFKKNLINLWQRISMSDLCFPVLTLLRSVHRKIRLVLSHSPVTHGKQEIKTPTLQSQVTGMKRSHRITGRILAHSLASHR